MIRLPSFQSFAAVALLAVSFISAAPSHAAEFVREYEYKVSDDDSKNSARRQAIEQLQYLLLQEVGTYIDGYAELDGNDTFIREEIRSITAGTAKTSVLDENWDGHRYWIKARLNVDPQEVLQRVNEQVKARANDKALTELKTLLSQNDSKIEQLSADVKSKQSDLAKKEREIAALKKRYASVEQEYQRSVGVEKEIQAKIAAFERSFKKATDSVKNVRVGMTYNEAFSILSKPRAAYSNFGTSPDGTAHNYGGVWVCYEHGLLIGFRKSASPPRYAHNCNSSW